MAIATIVNRSEPLDYNSLRMELERSRQLLAIGGAEYLAELAVGLPTVANIEHHARILLEYELKRELIDILTAQHDWLHRPSADPCAALEGLRDRGSGE